MPRGECTKLLLTHTYLAKEHTYLQRKISYKEVSTTHDVFILYTYIPTGYSLHVLYVIVSSFSRVARGRRRTYLAYERLSAPQSSLRPGRGRAQVEAEDGARLCLIIPEKVCCTPRRGIGGNKQLIGNV
jgi:hypothetical protein